MIDLSNPVVLALLAAAFWLLCLAWLAYAVYTAPIMEDHDSEPMPQPMHPDHERIINDYTRGRSWS